jgi:hypothetical protein
MGRKLIKFENERINIYEINRISKDEEWDFENDKMDFLIEINKPFNESGISKPHIVFKYASEELRDNKLEILEMLLSQEDDVKFIES